MRPTLKEAFLTLNGMMTERLQNDTGLDGTEPESIIKLDLSFDSSLYIGLP